MPPINKIGADKSGAGVERRREVGEAMMEGEGEPKNGSNGLQGTREAGPSGQGNGSRWKFW